MKKIIIPKNFFKGLTFKIKIVPHSTTSICVCPSCMDAREVRVKTLKEILKFIEKSKKEYSKLLKKKSYASKRTPPTK